MLTVLAVHGGLSGNLGRIEVGVARHTGLAAGGQVWLEVSLRTLSRSMSKSGAYLALGDMVVAAVRKLSAGRGRAGVVVGGL